MALVQALLLSVLMNFVLTEEPHCNSKFDFEEKVLEKLVRMEFNEKQRKLDLELIHSDVAEKLQKMESLSTSVIHQVDETATSVDVTVKQVAANTTKLLNDFEKKFADLEKQIMDKLNAPRETTPTVAFNARLSSNIYVTNGLTVVYPVVMFNFGDGYDASTGIFTSPVNGTYMFDIVLCPYNGKFVEANIVVDDKQTTVVSFYSSGGNTCYSANAVVVLHSKQQVKVKVGPNTSGGIKIYQDTYRWNTFSGSLIHT